MFVDVGVDLLFVKFLLDFLDFVVEDVFEVVDDFGFDGVIVSNMIILWFDILWNLNWVECGGFFGKLIEVEVMNMICFIVEWIDVFVVGVGGVLDVESVYRKICVGVEMV